MESQTVRENSFFVLLQSMLAFLWQIYNTICFSFSLVLPNNSNEKRDEKLDFIIPGSVTTTSMDSTGSISPSPSNEITALASRHQIQEQSPRHDDIHLSISEDGMTNEDISQVEENIEIEEESSNDVEEKTEYDSSNDSRTGNSDTEVVIEKSELETGSIVAPAKKKRSRRGKKKPKTPTASVDSTPQSTPSKPKQSTPNKTQANDTQDERFKHFRMRGNSKSNGAVLPKNNTQPKTPSQTGKHEVQETPRRFSHSALAQKLKDAEIETVKPVRQPIGPSLGTNGFSTEYQRQRRERMAIQAL